MCVNEGSTLTLSVGKSAILCTSHRPQSLKQITHLKIREDTHLFTPNLPCGWCLLLIGVLDAEIFGDSVSESTSRHDDVLGL